MNKLEFLFVLRERLAGLPEEDIERWLDYYSEIIDDRTEDGWTEPEAVEALGPVDDIVTQIRAEAPSPAPVKASRSGHSWKAWEVLLLVLGSPIWIPLLAAAAIILLAVFLVLWAVILVLYAADLSFTAGAVAGVLGGILLAVTGDPAQGVLLLGAGLICAGVTILLFFGCNQTAKGAAYLSGRILAGIRGCFIQKGDA